MGRISIHLGAGYQDSDDIANLGSKTHVRPSLCPITPTLIREGEGSYVDSLRTDFEVPALSLVMTNSTVPRLGVADEVGGVGSDDLAVQDMELSEPLDKLSAETLEWQVDDLLSVAPG